MTTAKAPDQGRLKACHLKTPGLVRRPAYDRSAHGVGIVHIGIGAFHRAHQAMYIDDVLASTGGDWRIIGVSCRSDAVREQLGPQDSLYTLQELGATQERYRIIGSLAGVLVAPENPEAVCAVMAQPTTHIISLTITEKGYCSNPATGHLDPTHPDIVHDLAHPHRPRSAIGILSKALRARHECGTPPPTLLCCDNLPQNGRALQRVLIGFAKLTDPGLARWIEREVACPSTMVDRLVPATTTIDIVAAASLLGYTDHAFVKAETFSQWIIEDCFAGQRPPLEGVGVQLVSDVHPYEVAKLRLLNGTHSMLAYLGSLAGYTYVHELMADRDFLALSRQFMRAEVALTLQPTPEFDVTGYQESLLARFANPRLNHSLRQIAMDGSQKLPQRLLETMQVRLERAQSIDTLALAVAGWMRYSLGRDEQGRAHCVNDPLSAKLAAIASSYGQDIAALVDGFLALTQVFGEYLPRQPTFRAVVTRSLRSLMQHGVRSTVRQMTQIQ